MACQCMAWPAAHSLGRELDQLLHIERRELLATGLVELALELHPMQTQGMKEALQNVHAPEHPEGNAEPSGEHEVDHNAIHGEGHLQTHLQRLLKEAKRQLLVRQRQRPDT